MARQLLSKQIHSIKFQTDSQYTGPLDTKGKMSGYGTYTFPSGVEYRGFFRNGKFHGRGMLIDKTNFRLCGYFVKGRCEDYQLFFEDGLQYSQKNWSYLSDKDRRFWIEINEGIPPVGKTLLTSERPSRIVPRGYYDTGEGFYHAKTGYIVDYVTLENIRYTSLNERKRIKECCRMNDIDFLLKSKLKQNQTDRDMSTDSWISND